SKDFIKIDDPSVAVTQPRRNPFFTMLMVAVLAAAIAGGYFIFRRVPEPEPPAPSPVATPPPAPAPPPVIATPVPSPAPEAPKPKPPPKKTPPKTAPEGYKDDPY